MNLEFWNNKKIRCGIIAAALVLVALISFVIRMIPYSSLVGTGDMNAGPDAWYNLRLLETALANSFSYLSFEPFTLYPYGQDIVWGPLFTWIAAVFTSLAGAATRIDLINAASLVPPVLALFMIPVMYFFGKKLGNCKCGLLAALFIALAGGEYLVRSVYGNFDHHIAEILFTTFFCLCYVWSLATLKDNEINFKSKATLKLPIIYGVITGFAYFLSLMTMTTTVVFGLMVSVFTLIIFIINQKNRRPTEYLLILNAVTFLVSVIGLLFYGIRDMSFSMYTYSLGLLIVNLIIVFGTGVLYLLSFGFKKLEKPWYFYFISIIVLACVGILVLMFVLPDVFDSATESLSNFFIMSDQSKTILEMTPWTWNLAWLSFNWGLFLSIGGIGWLIYEGVKGNREETLFVLIWTIFMFLATLAHMRWEYYIAANIALLSAYCIAKTIDFAKDDVLLMFRKNKTETKQIAKKHKKGNKEIVPEKKKVNILKIGLLGIVCVFTIVFVSVSAAIAVPTAESMAAGTTNPNWIDACEWLEKNTPETGLEYQKIYDKEEFKYPSESYGVLAWWDYGHYITVLGERIPVSNPFQSGIKGSYGVAKILLEQKEATVAKKFNKRNTKYVMTDQDISGKNFPAIAVWADEEKLTTPYFYSFYQPNGEGNLVLTRAYSPEYFNSLVVRLQNYDGSMVDCGSSIIVYVANQEGYNYPIMYSSKISTDANAAWKEADAFNADEANTSAGKHAYVVANSMKDKTNTYYIPSVKLSALTHFRMVFESDTSYVKTFEYVKGAVITGDGTIQATITTNTGRKFTYTQESSGGKYVVPYATGKNGSVTASAYTTSDGRTITVTEKAVQKGSKVN